MIKRVSFFNTLFYYQMKIKLNNIAKRYNYEWIFRNVTIEFDSSNNYVIIGANGSGKSTLLKLIAGNIIPSEGTIDYNLNNKKVEDENIFKHLSYASPYLELFEEFTLTEAINFQAQFKPFINGLTTDNIIELIHLHKQKDKQLKDYSSGMKQRVKLALAILADTPLLLLDEPTSNLDKKSIEWYQSMIEKFSAKRLIIVCSNEQTQEYEFCNKQLNIEDYKIAKVAH